ncbi:hypothetical protein NLI96_g13012 [Meripilus lineatus]|uniref:Uncharacterized protein n=1 Tax=Meripilus lineatus TaxID=2056292 RepID=A0AAD5Y7P2_9APHY|nr:hypothetical protein NLI96_g13012 [Physisporinus lineatus]
MPPPRSDSPSPKDAKSAKAKKKASNASTTKPLSVAQSTRSQTKKLTDDEVHATSGMESSPTTYENGQTRNSPDPFQSDPQDQWKVDEPQPTTEHARSGAGGGLIKQLQKAWRKGFTPPRSPNGPGERLNAYAAEGTRSQSEEKNSTISNSSSSPARSTSNGDPAQGSPALSYASLEVQPPQSQAVGTTEMSDPQLESASPQSTPSKRKKRSLVTPLLDLIENARNNISRRKMAAANSSPTVVEETPPPPDTTEKPVKRFKMEKKPQEEEVMTHIISPAAALTIQSTPLADGAASPPPDELPAFTPRPPMGFPKLQLGAPTEDIVGLAPKQLRDWKKAKGNKVLLNPFGYGGDNAKERNWVRLMLMTKLAVILDKDDLEVIPPIPERETGGINKPPFLYYLGGLTDEDQKKLIDHECWSAPDFTFFALPFDNTLPTFVMNIINLCGGQTDIRDTIIQSLVISEPTFEYLERLIRAHPTLSKMKKNDALAKVLETTRVTNTPFFDTNDVPTTLTSIYIESPALNTEQWCEWVTHIRDNVEFYGSFTGKGRRCPNFLCEGCHGVNHITEYCSLKGVPGWYGVHDIANIPRPYLAPRTRNDTRTGIASSSQMTDSRSFDTSVMLSSPTQHAQQPLFRSPYFSH